MSTASLIERTKTGTEQRVILDLSPEEANELAYTLTRYGWHSNIARAIYHILRDKSTDG